jgi:hypothetical protein
MSRKMTKRMRVFLNFDEKSKSDQYIYKLLSLMFDTPQKRNKFVTKCVKDILSNTDTNNFENLPSKKTIGKSQSKRVKINDVAKTISTEKISDKDNAKNDKKKSVFTSVVMNATDKLLNQ